MGSSLPLSAYDQSYGHGRTRQLRDLATSDTRLRKIAEHQTADMRDPIHHPLSTAILSPNEGSMSGPTHASRRHSIVAGTQDKDGRSSASRHRFDSMDPDRVLEPSTSVRHLPDTVSMLSRQLSRRDRDPPSRDHEDESSPSPDREAKSDRQRDKTRRHISRHDDPSLSRSPPTSYPLDYMNRHLKAMDFSSRERPRSPEVMTSSRRPSDASSIDHLIKNKFDFKADVISTVPSSDRHSEATTIMTRVLGTVDTGSDYNVIHKDVIRRAKIDPSKIKVLKEKPDVEGFEGMKYHLDRTVELDWGLARKNGIKTYRSTFYIVDKLPDDLEMVVEKGYLLQKLEKLRARDRSRR
ncbi:uncharacterized protein AB675_2626 [Cyphellophora attinorum]|uniref:Uncharacterized protein n=1 Tax=Cyphellophora attinorum TaxID=1664694 RepID=A0A0N0NRS5_9EURO|nr:uncharacterized protein AB675_2626 [Phialophora attinorum]KPI45169.1 hypothetical protein AB675_2626 [Phialophora attinorum]